MRYHLGQGPACPGPGDTVPCLAWAPLEIVDPDVVAVGRLTGLQDRGLPDLLAIAVIPGPLGASIRKGHLRRPAPCVELGSGRQHVTIHPGHLHRPAAIRRIVEFRDRRSSGAFGHSRHRADPAPSIVGDPGLDPVRSGDQDPAPQVIHGKAGPPSVHQVPGTDHPVEGRCVIPVFGSSLEIMSRCGRNDGTCRPDPADTGAREGK